jgi:hypothetical protein
MAKSRVKKPTIKIDDYINLIRKRAHEYSNKYHVDYDELESQGFLIYCEAIKTFNPIKAKFSTHLFIQLGRLGDYCVRYRRQRGRIQGEPFFTRYAAREYAPSLQDLINDAEMELSFAALEIMKWILGREWEQGKRILYPSAKRARITFARLYRWSSSRVEAAWGELEDYWRNIGVRVYNDNRGSNPLPS